MSDRHVKLLLKLAELANCNPFSPRRLEIEKAILGKQFVAEDMVSWNRRQSYQPVERPNVIALSKLAIEIVSEFKQRRQETRQPLDSKVRQAYWDVAAYVLLYRFVTPADNQLFDTANSKSQATVSKIWQAFLADYQVLLDVGGEFPLNKPAAAHLFACLVQIHRAFWLIFDQILGDSRPIAQLREKVWESVFGCDLSRYHDVLFSRLREVATLITGPSGTGKELVARAIGMSQYVPFNLETESFKPDDHRFLALNLSALSPTLIESELFGHHRGAFTGAIEDRVGWLETCGSQGAVFLDEIGELDASLQVKLLRVLQERTYCRLGESKPRRFRGKIISATNRNLETEIRTGRFREDFYFRICADRIETPSLRSQLDDCPSDLLTMVTSLAYKFAGDGTVENTANPAAVLATEACNWINENLGSSYPWTGNIRELEQCFSSYILRRTYVPLPHLPTTNRLAPAWAEPIINGTATADEVLRRYCQQVYSQTGSYEETARILQVDRRTVKAKLQ